MGKNLIYNSEELLKYYQSHRGHWEDFYPSEKWVFERIAAERPTLGTVLDVGCAGGGLGAALTERFSLESYTGIDIHRGIIDWAIANRKLPVPTELYAEDILNMPSDKTHDLVVSLSCADWNIETDKIVRACWDKVKPGGHFVISLRLTTEQSINDITESYQYINFTGDDPQPEVANYVVLNFKEALTMLDNLIPCPELIGTYGYWGKPSETARTPFEKVMFAVCYIRKACQDNDTTVAELHVPADIITGGGRK